MELWRERDKKLDKWLADFPFEDGIDGTPFDSAVIAAVEKLKKDWGKPDSIMSKEDLAKYWSTFEVLRPS
jgi:hypothetical protein